MDAYRRYQRSGINIKSSEFAYKSLNQQRSNQFPSRLVCFYETKAVCSEDCLVRKLVDLGDKILKLMLPNLDGL